MAYQLEKGTNDIVISGFEQGISNDPYEGIGNLVNINTTSIPKEASVNFATAAISPPVIPANTCTVSAVNSSTHVFTYSGTALLENYMCISFNSSGLTIGSVSANTPYWVGSVTPTTFIIYSDYAQTSQVAATNGVGTFNLITVSLNYATGQSGQPKFFSYDEPDAAYFCLTSAGDLWSNIKTTTSGYWTYCGPSGNTIDPNTAGGMAYYKSYNNYNSYIVIFRTTTIDYFILNGANTFQGIWVHNWNPLTGGASFAYLGTCDNNSYHTQSTCLANGGTWTPILNANTSYHNAYVGQDNVLYWCDGPFIGSLFETPNGPPQTTILDLSDDTTYTYALQALALPTIDNAQCIAELGVNLLIGGQNNAIYPWNRTSTSFTYPILLAEYNIKNIVTINTNSYVFVGNRGRIWITNGSQAQLFQKIPDFLSGTVEPYFTWGGACSFKNQLYFSAGAFTNGGTYSGNELPYYGGVWSISLDTNVYGVDTNKAIRMVNTLSYQTTTYAGYATCLIPNQVGNPAGTGLYIGWNSNGGVVGGGIDTTTSAPYAGGTTVAKGIVNSDLIPIGTFLKPTTNGRVEFKLAVPLVSGESIQLLFRQKFSDSFTAITGGTFNATGTYSGVCQSVNFENSQWIQLQAILTSTASSPSYVRLTELRLGAN